MAFELFVNGTLMRGLALHSNMGDSVFLGEFRTIPNYRLHTINDIHPGMYPLDETETGGYAIKGELYLVDDIDWQVIVKGEPPFLYRGIITLEDGREVYGILYPRQLATRYPEISELGGWREYLELRQADEQTSLSDR